MSQTALVMAGGNSARMRAGGCRTHKALRTIRGTSLLEWNLINLFSFGFTDVAIAVNEAEEQLLSTIDRLTSFACRHRAALSIVRESRPLGTIGAARFMAARTEDVLVTNVDNLTDLDMRVLFECHVRSGAALTVASHREPFRIPFGQLEISESCVTAYREKPTLPILISSGTYVLNQRAMSAIPAGEKTHAPDLINSLIGSGEVVYSCEHQAWWIDVNDEAALATAEATLMQRASDDGKRLTALARA